MPIFSRIVESLRENGIGVLHFQYETSKSTEAEKLRFRAYRDLPFLYSLRNLILGKKKEPLIPMSSYDLNKIMLVLQNRGCGKCFVRFTQHGVDGALIFFQKTHEPPF